MPNKLESVNCNICGNDNYEVISKKGQHSIPLSVVLCKSCGLGYLNPRWDAAGYIDFYKNEYDKYYRPQLHLKKTVARLKVNPIVDRLQKKQLLSNGIQKILDIGSGAGENLLDLHEHLPKSELFAIEPSIDSQELLKKSNITILSNDVNNSWDKDHGHQFDLIIMRHVLEHFLDPLAILKRVRNVLSENGVLYIAVPNNLKPTQSLEKSWFRVVHTYYFNKHSLKNILDKAGIEIIQITEGDPFNVSEVFLMAKKSSGEKSITVKKEHYNIQKHVFDSVKKKQKSPLFFVFSLVRKVKRRLVRSV